MISRKDQALICERQGVEREERRYIELLRDEVLLKREADTFMTMPQRRQRRSERLTKLSVIAAQKAVVGGVISRERHLELLRQVQAEFPPKTYDFDSDED